MTDAALRGLIDSASESLTYTCAPPSSGNRMGVDRDDDGFFDRDELDAGSDPADPLSVPNGGPTPTVTVTPTPTPLACGTPQGGCRAAGKGLLLIKSKPGKEKLIWKWLKGVPAVDPTALGDPTAATNYTLCVYASPLSEMQVSAGSGWSITGSGFKFGDSDAAQDGITKILLKAGEAGKSKVLVKAKGGGIPLPTMPLTPPVTVQLKNSDGECWESVFTQVTKNTSELYKAKF